MRRFSKAVTTPPLVSFPVVSLANESETMAFINVSYRNTPGNRESSRMHPNNGPYGEQYTAVPVSEEH